MRIVVTLGARRIVEIVLRRYASSERVRSQSSSSSAATKCATPLLEACDCAPAEVFERHVFAGDGLDDLRGR